MFRELLQNSSDAASKTVEIHFETEAYLNYKKSENGEGPSGEWKLPDLKTAKVRSRSSSYSMKLSNFLV